MDLPELGAFLKSHRDRQDVAVRRQDRKRLMHHVVGEIELNCLNLLSEDGTQRLLWFTPPAGGPAVEQLELLAVIGAQELSNADS